MLPWVGRWTVVEGDRVTTVAIECLAAPSALVDLHATLGRLLLEAVVE